MDRMSSSLRTCFSAEKFKTCENPALTMKSRTSPSLRSAQRTEMSPVAGARGPALRSRMVSARAFSFLSRRVRLLSGKEESFPQKAEPMLPPLPGSHLPRAFTALDAIPRTGSGKVKRAELRRLALDTD